jgi:hypothetical protein
MIVDTADAFRNTTQSGNRATQVVMEPGLPALVDTRLAMFGTEHEMLVQAEVGGHGFSDVLICDPYRGRSHFVDPVPVVSLARLAQPPATHCDAFGIKTGHRIWWCRSLGSLNHLLHAEMPSASNAPTPPVDLKNIKSRLKEAEADDAEQVKRQQVANDNAQ